MLGGKWGELPALGLHPLGLPDAIELRHLDQAEHLVPHDGAAGVPLEQPFQPRIDRRRGNFDVVVVVGHGEHPSVVVVDHEVLAGAVARDRKPVRLHPVAIGLGAQLVGDPHHVHGLVERAQRMGIGERCLVLLAIDGREPARDVSAREALRVGCERVRARLQKERARRRKQRREPREQGLEGRSGHAATIPFSRGAVHRATPRRIRPVIHPKTPGGVRHGTELLMTLARRHAWIAGFTLIAFYLGTLLAAVLLVVAAAACLYAVFEKGAANAYVLVLLACCCVAAAYGLVRGIVRARPVPFVEPGKRLQRADAPRLFSMLDELAQGAGIDPPHRVYLGLAAQMSVTETGRGFLGRKSERVVCLGAGHVQHAPIGLLRAMLAHELGHFAGGDTRAAGLIAFIEGAFVSVMQSTHAGSTQGGIFRQAMSGSSRLVGQRVVHAFAWLYYRLSGATSRSQELAADRLAAALAGRDSMALALSEHAIFSPLYGAFLQEHVLPWVAHGVCPSDLVHCFQRLRTRLEERGALDALIRANAEAKTDPFDSHPALGERLRILGEQPEGAHHADDDERGTALFAPEFGFDAWYPAALAEIVAPDRKTPLTLMPLERMVREVVPGRIQADAAVLRERFAQWHPNLGTNSQLFTAALDAVAARRVSELARLFEPGLPIYARQAETQVVLLVTTALFEAALLDSGATPCVSLGETSHIFDLEGERVRPGDLVAALPTEPDAGQVLYAWSRRLAARSVAPVYARQSA